MEKNLNVLLTIIGIFALCLSACSENGLVIGPHDPSPSPTAPSTLPELIESLSDSDYRVRLAATYALRDKGPTAKQAVPALITALSDEVGDVRASSADALGEIGPKAASAVPMLIGVLQSDEFAHARAEAAEALGKIGDPGAVPALANTLWDQEAQEEYSFILIEAAQAIARLTDNSFPDSEPGPHGYRLNEDGIPLIIIAARKWWETEGQYQEWPPVSSNDQVSSSHIEMDPRLGHL